MHDKVDIGTQGFVYPMPMTLIGADLPSGPNFMPVAWVNRVQYNPPRLVTGMGKPHATNAGIRDHGEFSVNFPSVDMFKVADWCGMNSALRGADKAAPFSVWRGKLAHAPLIDECPLSMECHVWQVVDLGSHELFIADIVAVWTEERFLGADGNPDIELMKPFTLTMPDNHYWAVGERLGPAWSSGRDFEPKRAAE